MEGKRQRAEVEAKVALEAIRGEATDAKLVIKHGVRRSASFQWNAISQRRHPDDERGPEAGDDKAAARQAAGEPALPARRHQPLGALRTGKERDIAQPRAHEADRRAVP